MPQTVDRIDFARLDADPDKWPKLSCSAASQLALEDGSLLLAIDSELMFRGGGQIRSFDDTHRLVFNHAGGLLELHEAGDIRFLTGSPTPTEKMRILATGQIGIGTATPSSPLHVTGDMRTDGALRVAGHAAVEGTLTVGSTVGIGTATPTQQLEVVGTVKATSFQGSGADLTGVSGTDSTKVAKTGDTMSGALVISAPETGLWVTHNAAVGGTLTVGSTVGTANPRTTLEIRGSGDPLLLINHAGASGHPALWLQQDGATKAFLWWDQHNNRLNLGTPTTNPIVSLQNNGNVGIGTANPAAPLHVASHMAVGPFAPTTGQGGIDVTGNAAEFGFVDRRLTFWPASPQPGHRFVWYNIDRLARLWAEASGDVLTVTSDGNVAYRGLLNKLEIADNFTATVRCGDFRIGHSGRRGTPGRALVDWTTILGLNWDNDWPEGVRYFGQFSRFSSRVLKENIADVSGVEALETLAGLQPVTFNFKADERKILQIGFIAEDVPMAIATSDRQGVVTSHIVAILTKVAQEQQTLITQLANKVKQLEVVITPGAV